MFSDRRRITNGRYLNNFARNSSIEKQRAPRTASVHIAKKENIARIINIWCENRAEKETAEMSAYGRHITAHRSCVSLPPRPPQPIAIAPINRPNQQRTHPGYDLSQHSELNATRPDALTVVGLMNATGFNVPPLVLGAT